MNTIRKFVANLWKFADRKKNQESINPIFYFLLRVLTKLSRGIWKVMNLGKKNYEQSILEVSLKKRPGDFTYNFCVYGHCGTFLSDEIAKISSPTVFLDIGANIGLFSILAAKNNQIEKIYAFEPDSRTLSFLNSNLSKNKCNNVEVIPFAISSVVGEHALFVKQNHSGASSLAKSDESNDSIQISTINEIYLNKELSIDTDKHIFIKIDVEGHELTVLEVLKKWCYFHLVKGIFLEFDIYMSDVEEIRKLLLGSDFHSKRKLGSATHWDELYLR